jgi:virulence factor Mce-like protein
MKRVLASASILLAIGIFVFVSTGASSPPGPNDPTFNIEFDNAFGLVTQADFKVNGVPAGTIQSISLDQKTLNAVVKVKVSQSGIPPFHSSVTCNSQPQSLIGEYFVSCDPGTTGPLLKSGATIPVTHTQSTIPADLLLDIMQMPERDRLPLIINSLGAGVAGRSDDLEAALDRAVPALTETDDLLNLLANDSDTLKQLTASSDQVITALANNSTQVQRFIDYANNAASDTATQQANLQQTLKDLPGFLAQLKPAMARLSAATQSNTPVLENLNAASGQLDTLFRNLPGFANASRPALKALGKASVTGKVAVTAARGTVDELAAFTQHTPELVKNLSIVLPWIDAQKHASETNARSPGGKGYSGLEALLQFAFNLAGATNYYGPVGHLLAVDGFVSAMCTPYATPATVAANLAQYGAAYRQCYSWLGPNQPGVNETDPSDPSACVPDPGGAPPGETGPTTSACKLTAGAISTDTRAATTTTTSHTKAGHNNTATTSTSSPPTTSSGSTPPSITNTLHNLSQTVSQVLGLLSNGLKSTSSHSSSGLLGLGSKSSSSGSSSSSSSSGSSNGASQTERLLNYLMSP